MLASLAMLGPFAVDTYLPSFTAIGEEFSAPPIAVQQTLSTYLFAFAFMMLCSLVLLVAAWFASKPQQLEDHWS